MGLKAKTAGLIFAGLIGVYAVLPGKKKYGKRGSGSLVTKKLTYESGGESYMKLRKGSRIFVTYDTLSPFKYFGVPTTALQLIDAPAGTIGFTLVQDLPSGAIDQVYVQAVDDSDNLMGEHKITVEGP